MSVASCGSHSLIPRCSVGHECPTYSGYFAAPFSAGFSSVFGSGRTFRLRSLAVVCQVANPKGLERSTSKRVLIRWPVVSTSTICLSCADVVVGHDQPDLVPLALLEVAVAGCFVLGRIHAAQTGQAANAAAPATDDE